MIPEDEELENGASDREDNDRWVEQQAELQLMEDEN